MVRLVGRGLPIVGVSVRCVVGVWSSEGFVELSQGSSCIFLVFTFHLVGWHVFEFCNFFTMQQTSTFHFIIPAFV